MEGIAMIIVCAIIFGLVMLFMGYCFGTADGESEGY